MKRREFITFLGSAAAAWPLAARAQKAEISTVGFLTTLGQNERPNLADAFRRGLSETGYLEGRNVTIEYRYAENRYDQLPSLAAELVQRKVAVIAATGGGNSILAAKAATSTIPIVFLTGGDPLQEGYVTSINRPGGNITGVNWFGTQLVAKGLGLLHELVPHAVSDAPDAAHRLGWQIFVLNAGTPSEIEAAFATLRQRRVGAILVPGDPFFTSRRQQIVALAARDAMPAMYFNREFVSEGGLMSYGNDTTDAYRRAGVYTGRILNGASPSDLPIEQATKFEFLINLKTAKTLGITVPPTLLARADEVIE